MENKLNVEYYALLAKRIRARDAEAFTEFYNATYNDLYRYVYYFLKDAHLAQDALHEIYILVWRSISALKDDRLFNSWMKQITYHVCCDFQKKYQSVSTHEASASEHTEFLLDLPEQKDHFQELYDAEALQRLERYLAELPAQTRKAFLLRYRNKLQMEQIADFLGVSLSTAKRAVSRARKYLRKRFGDTLLPLFLLFFSVFLLAGCGGGGAEAGAGRGPGPGAAAEVEAAKESASTEGSSAEDAAGNDGNDVDAADASPGGEGQGSRPNAPVVYEPEAPQTETVGADALTVDISHRSRGYVMARYTGGAAKANIQLIGPDGVAYKYFLTPSEVWTALPLTAGDGSYEIDGYENISGTQYAVLFKETMEVSLEDELLPFLYPSQYVNFSRDSEAVARASEIVAGASSDLDAVADIYHYVIGHVSYDMEKAETVQSGYLPDVDETLATGKGICFDYAALTAAMLRSQDIPTRLEIGYAGEIYHAWISVYTEETGWIDRLIEFTSGGWTRMDPTLASENENNRAVLKYIGDGTNYTTQYIR